MAGLTITGTVYTDEGVTPMGSGRTVKVSVGGAAAAASTTTNGSGQFTLNFAQGISAGQVFTVYLQGNTEVGATVIAAGIGNTTSSVAGVDVFQDYLCLRKIAGTNFIAASATGTQINTSDNNGDTGISSIYSSSSNTAFSTATGKSLYLGASYVLPTAITAISVGGNFTNKGTANGASSVTITLAGTGSQTLTSNASTLSNITINGSGGTYTLQDNLTQATGCKITITAGTLAAGSFTITTNGNWSNSDTFNAGSGLVTFASTATVDNGSGGFNNLSVTAGTLTPATNNLTVGGTLLLNGGGLNASTNSKTVTVAGLVTLTSGTYTCGSATQTFNGGLTINGGTLAGGSGNVACNGTLTLSSGTLTAPSGTFSVSGNWARSGGSFAVGVNTVTLNGTSQTISGTTTFSRLVKTVAAADTLTFTDGTTTTVSNALTLQGASGQLLTLAGTSTGGWTISVPTTQTLGYCSVSYCTATSHTAAFGATSFDGGHNTNCTFGSSSVSIGGIAATSGVLGTGVF